MTDREQQAGRDGVPWMENLSFTIRADSQDECDRIADVINKTAKRMGVSQGFCDLSQPQSEDRP